jgi:hypothetical protein
MEKRLEYLREHNENIDILSINDINNIDPKLIPNTWFDIFIEKDSKKRISSILSIWNKHVELELRNTISYLSEFLIDVELLKNDNKYSILYTLKSSDQEFYYIGGNPLDSFKNKALEESWDKIPSSIRSFYENVHNGFFYHSSEAMGLVPINSVTYFDDDEWGIIDDLEEPIRIDLKTTFGFFKSGMGGYVAIDYNNCENDNATLWWTNKPPRYNINFWDVVDEWTVIGFQS